MKSKVKQSLLYFKKNSFIHGSRRIECSLSQTFIYVGYDFKHNANDVKKNIFTSTIILLPPDIM